MNDQFDSSLSPRRRSWARLGRLFAGFAAAITITSSAIVGSAFLGIAVSPAWAATAPSWAAGQYFSAIQNVPFCDDVAVASSTTLPLTSLTAGATPSGITGLTMKNVNLAAGTGQECGTDTNAPASSGTPPALAPVATNSSGSATASIAIGSQPECTWVATGGTVSMFDTNQDLEQAGSQSAFGQPITGGETAGTSTNYPTCSADVMEDNANSGDLGGAFTDNTANPLPTPTDTNPSASQGDLSSSNLELNSGCYGSTEIFGSYHYSALGSSYVLTVPSPWVNGGSCSYGGLGSNSAGGNTDTANATCPPSQADVNEGYVGCSVVISSGNDSNASVNYSSLDLFFNGQPVPQTPTATLSSSSAGVGGTLSVTGGTNWWGSSGGAPNSGPYGDSQSGNFYQVTAPGVYVGTSRATAVPVVNSTVTIPANTYVCTGAESNTVGPNPCTMTPGQPTGSFQLPSGLSPGNYNIYIDESNTTPLHGNGPNDAYQTTTGHTLGTVESTTAISVGTAPSITSANATTFTVGSAGSFSVTTTGTPNAALSEVGSLPSGVTFVDNGNGTATLSGTPAVGTGGSYPITITANNGISPNATQSFTLAVDQAPAITSANHASFTAGSAGTFSVTTSGTPSAALSETGTLPSGVTFVDNGNGTATLAGTPAAGTGGSYPITITANNGISPNASQSFTLTVDQAPAITSGNATTFTVGSAGSFSVTTTGVPNAALSEVGSLPSGVTFVDNGNGTATLAGTPAAGTGGSYPITITATNGVNPNASQSFTLTVDQAPAITSANHASFTAGSAGTFSVTTSGTPSAALSETGTLPSGVTFVDNGNGTATLAGTPAAGTGGSYPITITANNGISPNASQSFTLTVDQAPAITSGNATTFTVGSAGSFSVTTTGVPNAALSEVGSLPSGVTFVDNGNGTATLAGTPGAGTGGSYPITITATNGVNPNASQSFTLTVDQAPAITSANHASFTAGSAGTFSVTTSGTPSAALSETGTLPSGVTFVDNGNGTATLAGTPAAGTGGSYPITITANNGISPNASQSFTLTVDQAPAITSGNATTFTVGSAGSFSVTTTGVPNAALSEVGSLPSGVTFVDNGNGTATLAGTPGAGTGGSYPITITATNGVNPNASQSFVLTVDQAPAITSPAGTTFAAGVPSSFQVTTTGKPTSSLSEVGVLPSGVGFTDNGNGTATLSGTPTSGGTYPITITASNGVAPDASQSFVLTVTTVTQAPSITSANSTTFTFGSANSFTVGSTGTPTPSLSENGTLPSGVTFVDNGDGTASLSGTPTSNGIYPLTITASNGVNPEASQSFTLTVDQAPSITSVSSASFVEGSSNSFTVTTSAFPTAALSETGTLPNGVSFVDNGDGTATLSGDPTQGGAFPITVKASNGVSPNASQTFTLTVDAAPAITSASSTTFTVGSSGSFTVSSMGNPVSTIAETGSLPAGVSFVAHANGTATLSGTPAAGTGGSYPLTITASNGVNPEASQSFTLTVDQAPSITSASSASFVEGSSNSFTVTTSAFPTAALSETGTLPNGVSFVDNGDGTATLSGTPAAGTQGTYTATLKASNGVSPNASQTFTLTVDAAPAITSASSTTFTVGSSGSFTVSSMGNPVSTIAETGSLPAGVSFVAHANGTATLSGTPAAGTGGSYPLTITASNGVNPEASQSFTLTVDQAPSITSASSASFVEGSSNSFTVTTSAFPTAALSETGTLPNGVSFVDNGDGTATLSGTPAAGTQGTYTATLKASNGVSPNASQTFTLTVDAAPAITSASSTTFTVGSSGSFTVSSMGNPVSTIAETGSLPAGVSFVAHANGTATLSGTPAAGTGGSYPLTITASNGVNPEASQSFTLTVDQAPSITSASSASFVEGSSNSFTVTTSAFPTAALSETGTLPNGVSFVDNGDGTATLSGDPTQGGAFPITVKASNGVSPNASQSFSLTAGTAPAITSPSSTTFTVGSPGSFTVTATGNPTPTITASGTLPSGVTFSGDTLSGTPTQAGTFQIGFVANNGISPQAVQYFTLTVTGLQITTGSVPAGTKRVAYSSTLQATGGVSPYHWAIKTGTLPAGLTLNSSTGTISGTPTRTGTYTFKVQVKDSSSPKKQKASATFTLTINA